MCDAIRQVRNVAHVAAFGDACRNLARSPRLLLAALLFPRACDICLMKRALAHARQ